MSQSKRGGIGESAGEDFALTSGPPARASGVEILAVESPADFPVELINTCTRRGDGVDLIRGRRVKVAFVVDHDCARELVAKVQLIGGVMC